MSDDDELTFDDLGAMWGEDEPPDDALPACHRCGTRDPWWLMRRVVRGSTPQILPLCRGCDAHLAGPEEVDAL